MADLQSVAFNQFSTHFHLFVTHSPLCFLTPSNGERRMCVLKHSKLLRLPVRKECFNTLGFFISQKRLHRLGRPFTTVYRVLRGPRFPYHVAVLAGIWPTFLLVNCSMILCCTFHLIPDQLFKLFLTKSVLHCPFCFFNLFLYHYSLKQKTPGVLIPRVLEVCCVNLCVTRQSSGPC